MDKYKHETETALFAQAQAGDAESVAIASDGTIFLANGREGMFAYTYSASTGLQNNFPALPENHALLQNYPNPFNPSTTIYYSLKKSAWIKLIIYDLLGREIITLVDEHQNPNTYAVLFNASDLASGIYYYQLQINNEMTEAKKMLLLR